MSMNRRRSGRQQQLWINTAEIHLAQGYPLKDLLARILGRLRALPTRGLALG